MFSLICDCAFGRASQREMKREKRREWSIGVGNHHRNRRSDGVAGIAIANVDRTVFRRRYGSARCRDCHAARIDNAHVGKNLDYFTNVGDARCSAVIITVDDGVAYTRTSGIVESIVRQEHPVHFN